MQIYTKILLGMFVGAVIGITLGPNSVFLEADVYTVRDAAQLHLRVHRDLPATELKLPADVPVQFDILETVREPFVDSEGVAHELTAWARVRFRFTRKLALRDMGRKLYEQLEKPEPNGAVEAWLRIEHRPVAGGGFGTYPTPVSGLGSTIIAWLRPVGKAFMRLIKMVIVPLVFASLLVGVAGLGDIRKLGRLGGKTLVLYLGTTAVAVTIGLSCAHIINPGSFINPEARAALQAQFNADAGKRVEQAAEAPSTVDNILNIIPENPVQSLASGNMLQIIFFAVIFGIALTLLDSKHGRPVVTFFDRVQNAMILIIHMVMATAPYGVAALIADVVGTSGLSVLKGLAVYGLAVVIGLFLHATLMYGGLVRLLTKLPFLHFLRAARPAQLIAFSTSSSSATLPVTMECAEENLGVSSAVSSFVLPLGSTVNMDGTALYQGVAAIFIAQVFQMDLSFAAQLGIVLTATMASIGAAGVPGAGMVTLAMVLTASGIPAVGVALILGMDRLLDMFRTAINVTGDLAVTMVMAVSEGETLRPLTVAEDAASPGRGFAGRLERDEHPIDPD